MLMSTQNLKDPSKSSTSITLAEEEKYTKNFDEVDYEKPLNPKEMEKIYGGGYGHLKKIGYSGKGCGARE
jgi:hypothetical protein